MLMLLSVCSRKILLAWLKTESAVFLILLLIKLHLSPTFKVKGFFRFGKKLLSFTLLDKAIIVKWEDFNLNLH